MESDTHYSNGRENADYALGVCIAVLGAWTVEPAEKVLVLLDESEAVAFANLLWSGGRTGAAGAFIEAWCKANDVPTNGPGPTPPELIPYLAHIEDGADA